MSMRQGLTYRPIREPDFIAQVLEVVLVDVYLLVQVCEVNLRDGAVLVLGQRELPELGSETPFINRTVTQSRELIVN